MRIIGLQPLQDTERTLEIIGPDTALYMYQKYRNDGEYEKADDVKERIESGEWHDHPVHVSFTGTEYQIIEKFHQDAHGMRYI